MKRLALKTINKLIQKQYPSIELVKGEGYFYFIGSETASEQYKQSLAMLQTTSVYVYHLNSLTPEAWLEEAAEVTDKATTELVERSICTPPHKIVIK